MEKMLSEIMQIPQSAWYCYEKTRHVKLPLNVPYLGMGSSYFAALTLKYYGKELYPEIASEFFNYISPGKIRPLGVLISQSGESSETLWCRDLFKEYVAITNEAQSSLVRSSNIKEVILLNAGREDYSSTKTYVNTLVVLYNGFGIDTKFALENLDTNFQMYCEWGEKTAAELTGYIRKEKINGIHFLGNGPNIATAYQAALTFSETTKISASGMPLSQYDHGPKESSSGSIIFMMQAKGPSHDRISQLADTISNAGAHIIPLQELDLPEILSPFTFIVRINCLSYHLAKELGIKRTFNVGSKITRVE
jgi:glucosamine--fructose-6-phosphate aminotransferase (isomerizing)